VPNVDSLLAAHALADDEEPRPDDPAPRSGRPDCANCGTPLAGPYCADCGQRDQPLRVPVHRFLAQSFTEFFGVDGRVWATLGVLLFKPGKLTAEYVAGRRRRYLRPLRVYLSTTLLFFVLLALLDPVGRFRENIVQVDGLDSTVVVAAHLAHVEAQIAEEPARVARQRALADSLQARADSLQAALSPGALADVPLDSLGDAIAAEVEAQRDALDEALEAAEDEADDLDDVRGSADERLARWRLEAAMLRALPPDSTVRLADVHAARAQIYPENQTNINLPEWMGRSESLERLDEARTGEEASVAGLAFARRAIGHVPTVLFLILPVFALILKVLYVRRGWYYSEHLVFGLHTHAFAFVVFTLVALLAVAGGGAGLTGVLAVVLWLTIPVYFLVAQKRVYGQGWIKTVVKALTLGWVYLFVLIGGLFGVLVLAAAIG
jgi:hypothetical protein